MSGRTSTGASKKLSCLVLRNLTFCTQLIQEHVGGRVVGCLDADLGNYCQIFFRFAKSGRKNMRNEQNEPKSHISCQFDHSNFVQLVAPPPRQLQRLQVFARFAGAQAELLPGGTFACVIWLLRNYRRKVASITDGDALYY